jgi:hypothetical protein
MAKILCSLSGILFQCEHMPLALANREYHHPMFSLPKKKLLSLAGQWAAQKLTATESYLLYLSLFNSTELIEWRAPAQFTAQSSAIVANNMENLIRIIGKIDTIKSPNFVLPKFVITSDTANLENSYHWIQSWISNYQDFQDGYKFAAIEREAERREIALERLIKSPYTKPDTLSNNIADWAEVAGSFPTFSITHPLTKTPISISEYWKQIIRAAIDAEKIWKYPEKDLAELYDHCESNIHHGTIYAATLMKRLREGMEKQNSFFDFGDIDVSSRTTKFTLLTGETSAFEANKIAAIQNAPIEEPKREAYPTQFAFMKAMMNYKLSQAARK